MNTNTMHNVFSLKTHNSVGHTHMMSGCPTQEMNLMALFSWIGSIQPPALFHPPLTSARRVTPFKAKSRRVW